MSVAVGKIGGPDFAIILRVSALTRADPRVLRRVVLLVAAGADGGLVDDSSGRDAVGAEMFPAGAALAVVFLADNGAAFFTDSAGTLSATGAFDSLVPDHLSSRGLQDLPVGSSPSGQLNRDDGHVEHLDF